MAPHRALPLLGLTSALLLTAACGGSDGDGGGSEERRTAEGRSFIAALATDPGNLDPSMSASTAARQMFSLYYDSLVYARDDGSFVSGLATDWRVTPDSVRFTLAEGITCADGSAFTASDVADNIDYIADSANGSPLLGVLVQPGTKTSADDAARTVVVTSPKPNGLLLGEMSGLFMLCRSGLDDHRSVATAGAGTGPYALAEAVPDDHYSFEPRPAYTWGPDGQAMSGPGLPRQVVVRIIPNQSTIANLLLSGEVTYAGVRGPDAQRIPATFQRIETPEPAGELWFNEQPSRAVADPAVREALVTAVDRAGFAAVATGGAGRPASSLITLAPNPCGATSSVSESLPVVDAAKAQRLLDDAGWRRGADGVRSKGGRRLELAVVYDPIGLSSRTAGMEFLAAQWRELGVETTLRVMPDAQLSEVLFSTGDWDVTATPFTFNLPSQLVGFVSGPASPAGANFAGITNGAYEAAVAKAMPLVGAESCPAWNEAERALVQSFNPAPMFDDLQKTFYRGAELAAPGLQLWGTSIRMLAE